jgi:glycosyltransferase involved in cell wall biosynthesis
MSMDRDLVSVVVPTYNRAHIVLDALKSVYQQSYRPIELIIVDDGSTDKTGVVVKDWISTLKVESCFTAHYVFQINQGGNFARNRGIQLTSGEYIAFLDSDDLWYPQKLEKQIAIFAADEKIGGVYCGLRHVSLITGVSQASPPRKYPSGNILHEMLVHDVTGPTSTYVLRSTVFEAMGNFDTQLFARQDWDMWLRLASNYNIGVVPDVLIDFREHEGVRTASNPQKEIAAYHTIMEKYAELRSRCPFAVRQAAKAAFYRRMGRIYFHHKISAIDAFTYQIRSILNWPFVFDSYAALLGIFLPRSFRKKIHILWNKVFGSTELSIRSH